MKNELKQQVKEIIINTNIDNTISITIEELSELIQALTKLQRYRTQDITLTATRSMVYKNITEELSDVYLVLEQIKTLYLIADTEIDEIISEKISRTLNKLQPKY